LRVFAGAGKEASRESDVTFLYVSKTLPTGLNGHISNTAANIAMAIGQEENRSGYQLSVSPLRITDVQEVGECYIKVDIG